MKLLINEREQALLVDTMRLIANTETDEEDVATAEGLLATLTDATVA